MPANVQRLVIVLGLSLVASLPKSSYAAEPPSDQANPAEPAAPKAPDSAPDEATPESAKPPGHHHGAPSARAGVNPNIGKSKQEAQLAAELIPLDYFNGSWTLVERHFGENGEMAEREGREVAKWTLDFQSIHRAYSSGIDTSVFRAEGTITWVPQLSKYVGSWFDNLGGVPIVVQCDFDAPSQTFTCMAEKLQPSGELAISHKVVEQINGDRRISTTFVKVGEEWVKRLEVVYTRLSTCPEGRGLIPIRDLG